MQHLSMHKVADAATDMSIAVAHIASMPIENVHFIAEWANLREMKAGHIAAKLGIDRSTVTRWFKGVMPQDHYRKRLAEVLGLSQPSDLFVAPNRNHKQGALDASLGSGVGADEASTPWRQSKPVDLPIYGSVAADTGEYFVTDFADVIDYCHRPTLVQNNAKAYALYVIGTSMEPRFFDGARIVVDGSNRPPRPNDAVVVQISENGESPTKGLLKTYLRKDDNHLVLKQYNPPRELKIDVDRVVNIDRVLSYEELAG